MHRGEQQVIAEPSSGYTTCSAEGTPIKRKIVTFFLPHLPLVNLLAPSMLADKKRAHRFSIAACCDRFFKRNGRVVYKDPATSNNERAQFDLTIALAGEKRNAVETGLRRFCARSRAIFS